MRYSLPSPAVRHNVSMYTPASFRITDAARLHALMRDYPFAVLVSADRDGLQTTHLPFAVEPG